MLPAGSGPRGNYPSVRSWRLVLSAIAGRWPDALFCLMGKYRRDGRTTTSFGRAEFDELRDMVPASVEAVDLPVIDQLATVAACDVLVSPHSGFWRRSGGCLVGSWPGPHRIGLRPRRRWPRLGRRDIGGRGRPGGRCCRYDHHGAAG